jgi:DNA-binding transcriptional ArsR family regulator
MSDRRQRGDDRDQQILSRLAQIQHKVDSIDETNAFALRAEADKHRDTVKQIFKRSKVRAQVYLAADGLRGVNEIADHIGVKRQQITPEIRVLKDEGLLELVDAPGGRDVWAKKAIDRTLRISKLLCEEYRLSPDGTNAAAPRAKRRR